MVYVTESEAARLGNEPEGHMIRWAEVSGFTAEDQLLSASEALAIGRDHIILARDICGYRASCVR